MTSYPGAGRTEKVSTDGGTRPEWSSNGREIVFRHGNQVVAVDVRTEPSLRLSLPRVLFEGDFLEHYGVAPDGQTFYMIRSVDKPNPTHINIVQNWFRELESLGPP